MRVEVGYALLILFVIALVTAGALFVRHRPREHERIWGRRSRPPR